MKRIYPHTKQALLKRGAKSADARYGVGVYFDYAASTPVDPAVKKAMEPYFSEKFGNPGSLHRFGQEAEAAVFKARQAIAGAVGADHREIIFTGSATEANNLALRGVLKGSGYTLNPRIITTSIEHESVLETCRDLEKEGVEIIYIPVSKEGIVDIAKIKKALNENTVLVSVMYANNEIGTIQPITEIAKVIRDWKLEIGNWKLSAEYPLFHTDAVQAFQYLDCDVNKLGVDLMTISAHKIYGPKGIGALYIRTLTPKPYTLYPLITGGGQESGLRSGTPNVPSIAGFAKAVELFSNSPASTRRQGEAGRELENKRIKKLRDYFWGGLKKINPKLKLNGSEKNRLPNNLNIYFPGHSAADLLIKLDLAGVAVSPGAACSARAARPSYVLEALGLSHNRCNESLRITLGRPTTKAEIDRALAVFKKNF